MTTAGAPLIRTTMGFIPLGSRIGRLPFMTTDRPAWWLDELAHAGNEHLDADYVASYDRKAGFDPMLDLELLRALGLDDSSTLVDLGAGSGQMVLAAARVCRRVVAVDVSPVMLDRLRARAEEMRLENVEYARAGFLTYAHRGEPADFVYSRNALHHLPDFWKGIALRRLAEMLRPGGVLRLRDLVFDFEPAQAEIVIEAWLASAVERREDGWTRPELESHLREEYSTYTWLLEAMLVRAGFDIREAGRSGSQVHAAYTCFRSGKAEPNSM